MGRSDNMNIYVMNEDKHYLQVEFTKEEQEHELFTSTIETVSKEVDTELIDGILHIQPSEDQKPDNIGILVDNVREQFQGDVIPLEKEVEEIIELEPAIIKGGKITTPAKTEIQTKTITKDLSQCPLFTFTPIKTGVEETPIKEEIKEEEPIIDEGKLQNTIPTVSRDAL